MALLYVIHYYRYHVCLLEEIISKRVLLLPVNSNITNEKIINIERN